MESVQCNGCKLSRFLRKCDAYPSRIPLAIWTGEHDHAKPYPNADKPTDGGIRFEPIERTAEATD